MPFIAASRPANLRRGASRGARSSGLGQTFLLERALELRSDRVSPRAAERQRAVGTADQVSRVEAIWQAALPELRKGRDDLDRQEAELSRLIETNADETVVTRQVDKVEAIRGHLNKARTMVIWHHRQLLTPEQRVKLKAMRDRDRERAGAPSATGGQRP